MVANTFDTLRALVSRVTCKPGWSFGLTDDDEGFRLTITVEGYNSRKATQPFDVRHFFPVPTTTWNLKSWRRWVFEQCRRVEDHELGEWFMVNSDRPFAPLHSPGNDPYTIRELSTEEEVNTDQRGKYVGQSRGAPGGSPVYVDPVYVNPCT